jgi:general secretion pathway protein E
LVDLGMKVERLPVAQRQRAAIVDHLRDRRLVDEAAIARAELVSVRTGQPIEQVLNQLGSLSDDDLAFAYAEVLGCGIWDAGRTKPTIDLQRLDVSGDYLRRARVVPLEDTGGILTCAACDPLDDETFSGLVFATGRKLRVLAARPADVRRHLDAAFVESKPTGAAPDERRLEREIDQVAEAGAEGSGARLVAAAFEAAISANASDIHFEPRRNDLRVRLRVDGRLIDHATVAADLAAPAVSRVKVIANLDIGEKRLPQDGRTTFVIGGRQVDVRVATSPTVFGESAVLRILDRSSVPLDLDSLGFDGRVADVLRRAARAPHGMFLVTGPTGSGKTTTLYALLQTFAGSPKKVLSVEDPVEFHFDHVTQTQVAPQLGLTFAKVLRSFLRQDPDVILVGEIRDPETAAVAVQAAMTGHLVFASVHANDALAVLPRLQDMGVEPYRLAAAFRGAAAQRLVRRLCTACREPREPTDAELEFARSAAVQAPSVAFDAVGCLHCKNLGFRGRVAISEAFFAGEALLRAIADRAPLAEIARSDGLGSMAADGVARAAQGLTTFEEVTAAVDG